MNQSVFVNWIVPLGRVVIFGFLLVGMGACRKAPPVNNQDLLSTESVQLPEGSHPQAVTTYQKGKYSSGLAGVGDTFADVTDEERALQIQLLQRVDGAKGNRAVLEDVLAEARTLESKVILSIAFKVLESPDAEIRAQGLMLVDGMSDGAVVPLLEKGYDDADLDVRQLAMELALIVRSPEVERLMNRALNDEDETIRQTGFQVGLNQEGEIAERALVQGMASSYEDLGLSALAMAENELSKRLLPSVFKALDHPSLEVKENAQEMMYFFFHEKFSNGAEAAQWWGSNGRYYDDDLVYGGPTQ